MAVSYAMGVVLALISRALVDSLGERGPRALVFKVFAHANLDDLVKECLEADREKFEKDLSCENRQRGNKKLGESIARWNAVYRSALRRTTRVVEVDRRRAQGRFLRNLFLPASLMPLLLLKGMIPTALGMGAAAMFMLLLYVYAEYVIFAEAYDIADATSK